MPGGRPKLDERKKFKTMHVDPECVDLLNDCANKLERVYGFRPTLSQTIRHLIKKEHACLPSQE